MVQGREVLNLPRPGLGGISLPSATGLSDFRWTIFRLVNSYGSSPVMRRCFTAERSLLFPLCYKSRHLHLSQRWYADTKAAAGNDEVLLDLLDRIGQNTTRTTNSRRQESKDVRVPQLDGLQPSIPHLPLSPLMDPKLVAARKRYRTPKPTFSGLPSKFQKKLSMSPYGM